MFVQERGRLESTFGYHPDARDLQDLLSAARPARLLVTGPVVPDVRDQVDEMRHAAGRRLDLPTGLYWFAAEEALAVMTVAEGDVPGFSEVVPAKAVGDEHPLSWAREWLDTLWAEATVVPAPRFGIHDDVIITKSGADAPVRRRRFSGGTWVYEVRVDGQTSTWAEAMLAPLELGDDPVAWSRGRRDTAERFSATLTREKLSGASTDTVFSFRATRTLFRSYQFRPVIRMLESGKSRILVADEVGLGKTIEAGLIWTELEARAAADRVLVVCPASLVEKWRHEMEERFGFMLTELSGAALTEFAQRVQENRLPKRFSHVISMERLRTWDDLEDLVGLTGPLNLAIVDEAHIMRNSGTRSFAAGSLLSEWAEALVLLTATPINLRNQDLFNLLELLTPGEFGEGDTLELQLEPNTGLNRLARLLSSAGADSRRRLDVLDELAQMTFGRPLMARPEYALLRELVGQQSLAPRDLVRAKRYIADLNALSSVLTRTRRVEVDEKKALRDARDVEVPWSQEEQAFYEAYVDWCRARAAAANVPLGFAMQMPLRLASACLPAARDAVLAGDHGLASAVDEDGGGQHAHQAPAVRPHAELVAAARALGERDSKCDLLLDALRDVVGSARQALVFTFSRPTLTYLAGRVGAECRVAVLHGGVPRQRRHEIIADFRAGAYDVVLANRVASEGLDFEFCSVVVNYDLPWNPMEVEQRIGRIDRIGQAEDKIAILNLWCAAALDEQIKLRLLQRIGVFEGSIGALEPIITEHMSDLRDAVFDFSLDDVERQQKADATLAAIEAQRAGLEDLASASPFLLAAGSADVAGMEQEIVSQGRYVGGGELLALIKDWALTSGAPQVVVTDGGASVRVRGNAEMADRLRQLSQTGRLHSSEVERYRAALLEESELHLSLDHEFARTSRSADLLSARHPLVLAAMLVPEQRHARFASVSVARDASVRPGRYVVLLATARWGSVRPGQEVWGVTVTLDGAVAGQEYADLVLAALARGDLAEGPADVPDDIGDLVEIARHVLDTRMVEEDRRKTAEAEALTASRHVLLEEQHRRRLDAIRRRRATAVERGSQRGVRLFDAQERRAVEGHNSMLAEVARLGPPNLSVTPLAVCLLEVADAH
jgi:hypothetical protein